MKNEVLYRHILTGVLILLLPVIVLTGFIQTKILGQIKDSYIYQLENQVMYNVNDMEQIFYSLDTVTTDMVYNEKMYTRNDLKDVSAAWNLLRELHGYTISNVFIKELIFWYEGDDYVYLSSGSSYRKDGLYKLYPFFKEHPVEDVIEAKSSNVKYYFADASNDETGKEQVCAATVNKAGKQAYLIFVLDLKELNTIQNFFAFDKHGNLLFSTDSDEKLQGNVHANEPVEGYLDISFEKESRNYVRYYSEKQVYANFWKIQIVYCGIVAAVVLCGIFLIYLGVKNNLIPALRRKQEFTDSAQFSFLHKLLKGRYTKEEFQRMIEEYRLSKLDGDVFFIMVFLLPEKDQPDKHELIESILQCYLKGYLLELPEGKKYVYIGSLSQAERKDYDQAAHMIWKSLEEKLQESVSFSMGALFEEVEEIQQVFLRTSLALEMKFAKGNSCFIDSDQLFNEELVDNYWPKRQIDYVLFHIRLGNQEEVMKTLDELNQYIKTSRMPLVYSKGICYDLIMQLIDLVYSTGIFGEEERPSYSMILNQSDTVDELTEKIRNIARNICFWIMEKKKQDSEEDTMDMEQFIKDHGLQENFSVQYMADYFSMSASKLSNVYKKKTGNTIMEHVTQIRMAMAEQLLLSEDPVYTVNEIVEKIGYNNTSSFIRKFKSIYGVTPGQYVKAKKV